MLYRYVPEKPKIEFVDIDFFPEKKYQLFDEIKPSLEKIVVALKDRCMNQNIFLDEDELKTLGMMTGTFLVFIKNCILDFIQILFTELE